MRMIELSSHNQSNGAYRYRKIGEEKGLTILFRKPD